MIRAIHRLITSVSVRTRVVVLAAIPVIGFLVNGIVFMVGQYEVERAFHAAAQATNVSEASREFRVIGQRDARAHARLRRVADTRT